MRSRDERLYWGLHGLAAALVSAAMYLVFVSDMPVHQALTWNARLTIGLNLIGTVAAIGAASRRGGDRATARAWSWVAAALGLMTASSLVFSLLPAVRAFPSPGDALRLAFVPVMLTGLLLLPRRHSGPGMLAKLLLDVAVVVIAGGMVMWYFVVGPALTQPGLNEAVISAAIAYPVGDLVLLFGVGLGLLHGVDRGVRLPLRLIATGMVFEIIGNTWLGFLRVHPGFHQDLPWQIACWLIGHLLLVAAAIEQNRNVSAAAGTIPASNRRTINYLPYGAVLICLSLLGLTLLQHGSLFPWGGLIGGSALLIICVMGRQTLALRENHRLAVTDALTGLANRAELQNSLDRALARAVRTGRPLGVLLADLNGFKEVNDTLGHAAGDRMLVEFGIMLRRSVLGGDQVARLGGDEFAVVLNDVGSSENTDAVIRRIREQMTLPLMIGDVVVHIQAAIGAALSEVGDDPDRLLARADAAMYEDKRARKPAREAAATRQDP